MLMQNSLRLITVSMVFWLGLFSISNASTKAIPYPDSGAVNNDSHTFTATTSGQIGAYFFGSTAAYTNTLSLLVNGVITPQTSGGVLNNHTSSFGDFVILGYANAGDVLTFQLNVLNTGETWYSNESLNTDGMNHAYSTTFSGNTTLDFPMGTYVGFEDVYGGGDSDYNDETFVFTNISYNNPVSPVPEPDTYATLLAGLGLIVFTMRRRKIV